ncbi:MAG TPA: hypothetical protein VNL70_06875 [Tepidisphaeraceae bacterium]|nr:hypothetical protein [Tepidisphaeraceae bacterium]
MILIPGALAGWLLVLRAAPLKADLIDAHPTADDLKRIFATPPPEHFRPTGISRSDYLKLMAANIDFFKQYQNPAGAVIDPVSKGERQYSTPAFAAAAGLLVKEAARQDLLDPACRAMSCALTALVEKRAADGHSDFYIPLLVHAYRFLKPLVPEAQAQLWATQFRQIDPKAIYRADLRGMNWNIVSSSGELLRRKDGLVADERLAEQMQYLETCLGGHLHALTPLGLFADPGAPMAYDAFARLWLEDVFADDAYDGAHAQTIGQFLRVGGLSTLLLLSPSGEWASGGRSALHNWNDLQITAICEINAAYWKRQDRLDIAGAFKRAAHLAFESAARWQRPSGELWIVKNRAQPHERLGFERYSNHSQYNLLPMAMLAIACSRADESIAERPCPAEVGGYVFDARQTFHKVAAAAGGYYVLIDSAADPHYNATGLQRVHRAGVPLAALGDSAAGERVYGPDSAPKAAISPGITWQPRDSQSQWLSLADFPSERARRAVQSVQLNVRSAGNDRVDFELAYALSDPDGGDRLLTERYVLSADGVEQTSSVSGAAAAFGFHLPVLVSDGAQDLDVKLSRAGVSILQRGSLTSVELDPQTLISPLTLQGPRVATHSGYVRRAIAKIRSSTVTARIRMSHSGP